MQLTKHSPLQDALIDKKSLKRTMVVMQPTVLPWAGYFNLMHLADDFVFFDDVQLEKRSWQTRNRLLREGKAYWITLPIKHAGLNQKIFETWVATNHFWESSVRKSFGRNYGNHTHFHAALEILNFFLDCKCDNLADRNISTILFIADKLQIHTRIHRASEICIDGVRSDRLIKLCDYFKADIYLSPNGAKEYLELDDFARRSSSQLLFQNYDVLPYPQLNSNEFIPCLSIVDLIANLGIEKTYSYVIGNA